ncbi:MAG TPA: glycosyltransferase family 4 protein [Flavipsychrobacter sp.]|nr:glycosyltransferase family 4 protein [Flavipsychrobacter sp.]
MKKLAIIDSHPIQYNAPVFKLLAERKHVQIKVFYTWGESVLQKKFDPGFGKTIEWDIPLLEGYDYQFVENVAQNPNASSYSGIDNPHIFRDIDAWQPDFLLIFGWSFKTNLRILRHYRGKIPIIFRGDSTLLREKKRLSVKKVLRRLFLTWIYRHVDVALYVGSKNREYYLAHGLKQEQLVYAPHAIDNHRFADLDEQRNNEAAAWRSDLGIPTDHLVVLYAGKLEPVKNLDFVIDLAQDMQEIPLSFIIVGNGPEEARLKQKASALKQVKFIDFQNQGKMPLVYRLGDVVILCSQSETWGLALNEAMSCGRAVMASSTCGGGADLIQEGANGIVFELNDKEKVKRYLTTLQSNPNELAIAGKLSKKIIADFSFAKIAEAIEYTCNSK